MEVYQFICNHQAAEECLSRKLFGSKSTRDYEEIEEGDTLILRNYKDGVQYGPFTATTQLEKNLIPEAWNGRFPYQVEVDWGDLYQIDDTDCPFPMSKYINKVDGPAADEVVSALDEHGIPIEVSDSGQINISDEAEESEQREKPSGGQLGDDQEEPERAILKKEELNEPLPSQEILETSEDPGEPLLRVAVDGELRPEKYREALAHLVAGKNLIFYGPPGSGKTRAAERLGAVLCSELHFSTANAEWSQSDIVGGYRPEGSGFVSKEGILTSASRGCEESLDETDHPEWLIIDEINRANLDQAFGEVFTILDLTHRHQAPLTFAGQTQEQPVPLAFRILATMNTEDQAQLFSLGYAFRRRFAFIPVPSLLSSPTHQSVKRPKVTDPTLADHTRQLRPILEREAVNQYQIDPVVRGDSPLGLPVLSSLFDPGQVLDDSLEDLSYGQLDFIDALLWVAQALTEREIVEIGQGIVIDAVKFVMATYYLFPSTKDWTVVDQAVEAYILPQVDSFTSELRKANTIATESDAITRFEQIIDLTESLGLAATTARLEQTLETNEII